jgi:predicted transcriptional regulator
MNKQTAIKLAGSVTALANILGISKAAVSRWKKVPELRVYQLKVIKPEWFVNLN